MNFYQANLALLAVANACSMLYRHHIRNHKSYHRGIQEDEHKQVIGIRFQRQFLVVYALVAAADWLQVCKKKESSSSFSICCTDINHNITGAIHLHSIQARKATSRTHSRSFICFWLCFGCCQRPCCWAARRSLRKTHCMCCLLHLLRDYMSGDAKLQPEHLIRWSILRRYCYNSAV